MTALTPKHKSLPDELMQGCKNDAEALSDKNSLLRQLKENQ